MTAATAQLFSSTSRISSSLEIQQHSLSPLSYWKVNKLFCQQSSLCHLTKIFIKNPSAAVTDVMFTCRWCHWWHATTYGCLAKNI